MFGFIKNTFVTPVVQSKTRLHSLQNLMSLRVSAFRQGRSTQDRESMTHNFTHVLHAWGIAHDAIPTAIAQLRLRCYIFFIPIVVTTVIALCIQSSLAYISLICVALPCILGCISTVWRIYILQKRQFIPFLQWVLLCVPFVSQKQL